MALRARDTVRDVQTGQDELDTRRPNGGIVRRVHLECLFPDGRHTLESLGETRMRVSLEAECRFNGLLVRLLGPVIGFAIRRADGGQIASLKRVIEGP